MAEQKYLSAPDPNETGWPKGVPYIIGNEGCERFSFYGMRAILYLYIVSLYVNLRGMPEDGTEGAKAAGLATYHLFNGAVYAIPIIGAILADRLLGKYRTILWLSMVYCLGHACLAVFESTGLQEKLFGTVFIDPIQGLYIGLGLIALGSGGIKPCVSAHVGDQFGKSNWHLLQKIFNAFYFIINFGSAFSTLLIPWVRGSEIREVLDDGSLQITYEGSVSWAFAIPGILMGLATWFFWMGRTKFVHVPPTHPGKAGLLDVLSGTALFLIVGIPVFFGEFFPIVLDPGSGWSKTIEFGAVGAACLVLFVWLFSARQKVEQDDGFLAILFYCLRTKFTGKQDDNVDSSRDADHPLAGQSFFAPAVARFGGLATEGPVAVLKIMSVFIFVAVFWALFDQHSSTWIDQAKLMDLRIDFSRPQWLIVGAVTGAMVGLAFGLTLLSDAARKAGLTGIGAAAGIFLGWIMHRYIPEGAAVEPSQVPALNPFMVMLLIPYTAFGLYPLMDKLGFEPRPLRRMSLGMFVASGSFVTVALIQAALDSGTELHVGWQLIPYAVMTLGEVMVSVTGLEFAYSQAPKRMKSVIMGFWLLMVTLGNLLVAFLAGMEGMSPQKAFWIYAAMMAVAGGLFALRASYYRYKDYTQ